MTSKVLHLRRPYWSTPWSNSGCTHGLTYATMRQDPHEFIINTEWKTTSLKNNRKEVPVVPIKITSMRREPIQSEITHAPIKALKTMPCPVELAKIIRRISEIPATHRDGQVIRFHLVQTLGILRHIDRAKTSIGGHDTRSSKTIVSCPHQA